MTTSTDYKPVREFQLIVDRDPTDPDGYGLTIQETNGRPENTVLVARANPTATRRVLQRVTESVRRSGHAKTALHPGRSKPLTLDEEAGVRLSLVVISTSRLSKARRIEDIADGIAGMTTEEAYYWYAKAMGSDARRVRRALRLFLSQD